MDYKEGNMKSKGCETCPEREECNGNTLGKIEQSLDEVDLLCDQFNELMRLAMSNMSKLGMIIATKIMMARLEAFTKHSADTFGEKLMAIISGFADEQIKHEVAQVKEMEVTQL